MLPLLRRTFGGFAAPERANIGRAARHLTAGTVTVAAVRPGAAAAASERTRSTPSGRRAYCGPSP